MRSKVSLKKMSVSARFLYPFEGTPEVVFDSHLRDLKELTETCCRFGVVSKKICKAVVALDPDNLDARLKFRFLLQQLHVSICTCEALQKNF